MNDIKPVTVVIDLTLLCKEMKYIGKPITAITSLVFCTDKLPGRVIICRCSEIKCPQISSFNRKCKHARIDI